MNTEVDAENEKKQHYDIRKNQRTNQINKIVNYFIISPTTCSVFNDRALMIVHHNNPKNAQYW